MHNLLAAVLVLTYEHGIDLSNPLWTENVEFLLESTTTPETRAGFQAIDVPRHWEAHPGSTSALEVEVKRLRSLDLLDEEGERRLGRLLEDLAEDNGKREKTKAGCLNKVPNSFSNLLYTAYQVVSEGADETAHRIAVIQRFVPVAAAVLNHYTRAFEMGELSRLKREFREKFPKADENSPWTPFGLKGCLFELYLSQVRVEEIREAANAWLQYFDEVNHIEYTVERVGHATIAIVADSGHPTAGLIANREAGADVALVYSRRLKRAAIVFNHRRELVSMERLYAECRFYRIEWDDRNSVLIAEEVKSGHLDKVLEILKAIYKPVAGAGLMASLREFQDKKAAEAGPQTSSQRWQQQRQANGNRR
ncbi:hypothetical protein HY734_00225 [Candidatus Uhrbacteria bacterium]|nr:hypothetical protein [Candidatus Uhrbacteria bacterium]